MKKFWIIRGIKIGLFVILAGLVIGFVVMSLWNYLVPGLFNGPVITFYQALGILILSKILFGGFKKGGHCSNCHGGGWGRKPGDWRQHWKEKMEAKMSAMTPEEKEKFKQKFGNKCSSWVGKESEEC